MSVKPASRFLIFRIVFIILLLASAEKLAAQTPFFRNLKIETEATDLKIRTLYQDKKGFIWLGTSAGLFRYDGITYTLIPGYSSKTIDQVTALFEDRSGILWVGYESGNIATCVNGKLKKYDPEEGTPKVPVLAIHQTRDSVIWFATYGEGVYYIRNKHVYNINKADGLKDEYVYALAEDKNGNIWLGTDGGLANCKLNKNKKTVKTLTTAQGLPDNIVMALNFTPDGILWIGTHSSGICRYLPDQNKFELPAKQENMAPVHRIGLVGNEIWAGTSGNGVVVYDRKNMGQKQVFNKENGCLPKITSLLTDTEGNVWLAGNGPGYQITNPKLRFLKPANGNADQNIQAVLQDRKGNIWISGPGGLQQQKKDGSVKKYLQNSEFKKVQGLCLFEDKAGFIWIGTFGQGVFRLQPETGQLQHFDEKNGLVNNNVLSITGAGNEIWLATLGGVSRCILPEQTTKNKQLHFENFSQKNGLGINYIYHVFIDSKKRVWFATDGSGVTVLQEGKFRNYTEKDGLKSEVVYTITEDNQGIIWLNTLKGLHRFDGKKIQPYIAPENVKTGTFTSVISDNQGNLLLVHNQGIDVLHTATGNLLQYGSESGLVNPEANLNAVSRGIDGSIWIGLQKELVQYTPSPGGQQAKPKIVLKEVQLFLKPITANQKPVFGHNQNHISFDYIGLWYQNPEKVSYQVKLEGYDSEWISSRNRFITYPNLTPGEYTLRVKASENKDFRQAPETVYKFTIKPPFWHTIPFYIIAGLTVIAAGYTIIRSREKKLKATERMEKEKAMFQFETLKSQVNPHFLFNSFNTLIAIIENDREKAVSYVEKLSDFFRDILVYREKDVISLKEELQLIETYYFLQRQRFGDNFKLELSIAADPELWFIAPLTLQLLVENAVKHNVVSKSNPLLVKIYTTPDNYLVVENVVRKKKIMEPSTKIGLQNIQNRYKLLTKRPLKIEASGAVFSVAIPLLKQEV